MRLESTAEEEGPFLMKIVVFGPFKRTGALHGESVVDLSHAYAKYLQERTVEPNPLEMADVVVPSDLARLIEGGPRALEAAQQALDYLFGEAQNNLGPRGERLVHRAADGRLHAPRPNNARIACAGGNFADHAAAMAVKMRGKPYEGDAYQEIRNAGFWGFWKLGREIVGPDGELIYGHVRQAGGDSRLKLRRHECSGLGRKWLAVGAVARSAIDGMADCAAAEAPLSSPAIKPCA